MLLQPLYIAGMCFKNEISRLRSSGTPDSINALHLSTAQQNLSTIVAAMSKMERYWAGFEPALCRLQEDPLCIAPTTHKRTFISMPDEGQVTRFRVDRNHPNHIAPPTDRSMQEFLTKKMEGDANQNSECDAMRG